MRFNWILILKLLALTRRGIDSLEFSQSRFTVLPNHCLTAFEGQNVTHPKPNVTSSHCGAICLTMGDSCNGIKLTKEVNNCVFLNFTKAECWDPFDFDDVTESERILIKTSNAERPILTDIFLAQPEIGSRLTTANSNLTFPQWKGPGQIIHYQHGALSCSLRNQSTKCFSWTFGSSQWVTFPNLITPHDEGTLGSMGGVAYVVGSASASNSRSVEVFNETSKQWEHGPLIQCGRSGVSLAGFKDRLIILLGKINDMNWTMTNKVEMLRRGGSSWESLADFPNALYNPTVGAIEFANRTSGVLVIGGAPEPFSKSAHWMDLKTLIWTPWPAMDAPAGVTRGHVFLTNSKLIMNPRLIGNYTTCRTVYYIKMISTESDAGWEEYDNDLFTELFPILLHRYSLS